MTDSPRASDLPTHAIHLQVCYAAALRGSEERRWLISNVQQLLRASRGRGVVLSRYIVMRTTPMEFSTVMRY
jgi:hypothetical protein